MPVVNQFDIGSFQIQEIILKFKIPLLLFLVLITIYIIGGVFIVFHLLKFGLGREKKILSMVFITGSIILLTINIIIFFSIDWQNLINSLNINIIP